MDEEFLGQQSEPLQYYQTDDCGTTLSVYEPIGYKAALIALIYINRRSRMADRMLSSHGREGCTVQQKKTA